MTFHREMAERVAAKKRRGRSGVSQIRIEFACSRAELGFAKIEDLDRAALVARYLPDFPVPFPGLGRVGHVVCRMATR